MYISYNRCKIGGGGGGGGQLSSPDSSLTEILIIRVSFHSWIGLDLKMFYHFV